MREGKGKGSNGVLTASNSTCMVAVMEMEKEKEKEKEKEIEMEKEGVDFRAAEGILPLKRRNFKEEKVEVSDDSRKDKKRKVILNKEPIEESIGSLGKKEKSEGKENNEMECEFVDNYDEYTVIKKPPICPPICHNDIYVSRKSSFASYVKRAKKLLYDEKCNPIIIHGLGAAINTAVNLACYLKSSSHCLLELSPWTSSVTLFDELLPLSEDQQPSGQCRINSAIHIRVRIPDSSASV